MIRVLVADDEPLVSAGVRAMLDAQPGIDVIVQAAIDEVVEAAAACNPDVIVMEAAALADVIGKVVAGGVQRVLVLTAQRDIRVVVEVLSAGAAGYLLKMNAPDALVAGVHAVAGGGMWLDPAIAADLLAEVSRQPVGGSDRSAALGRLTPREQEVLVLITRGMSDGEIAEHLFISGLTVRTHVGRVLTKLGARNRAHAVTIAYQLGLVRMPAAVRAGSCTPN